MVKTSPGGEMVDTIDSKSIAIRRGGSIPLQGNKKTNKRLIKKMFIKFFPFYVRLFFKRT